MAFTPDWANKIIHSDASISDFPAARSALRALEETELGMVNKSICTFDKLDLGGGAWMYSITFINGYTLQFPASGAYSISGGNFNGMVNDTGVQVIINRAAAYAVTASGGTVLTPDEHNQLMALPAASTNAAAVWTKALEGSLTAEQIQRLLLSALAGKVSGAGTGTEAFRDTADTKDRLTVTVDANGNRTAVVRDAA